METNWMTLGLKCGLEIHQQLDTAKLFCDCPSTLRDDQPDIAIMRELRASAGEEGSVDVAAAAEQAKGKRFRYQAYTDSTCLVELDEEPPHALNREAMDITLQVAKLLAASPVDFVEVMRKTVVDGSNTSGFQRTALVARHGAIGAKSGRVTVPTLCLEEDAAKIVSREAGCDTYNLSRLGIPLIEIATGPEITTPEMALDVAAEIGMLLRSTGRVKRGLGTIRQDLNVSIAGGTRIEIKGAQELDLLPTLVANEAQRQRSLIEIAAELKTRKAAVPEGGHAVIELSKNLKDTKSKILRDALDKGGGAILGVRLVGFAGLLGREVQPGRRLGTELADYAREMGGVRGLFHSDELPGYGVTPDEVALVRKTLTCKEGDGFVLIADARDRAQRAMAAALQRARFALSGVPKEVRKANPDGTSSYLRPMPGASRMYPETDVRGIRITEERVAGIVLPELLSVKEARFAKQYALPRELAHLLAWSTYAHDFEGWLKKYPSLRPVFVAETLATSEKEIRRRYNLDLTATSREFDVLFAAVHADEIAQDAVFEILLGHAQGKPLDLAPYRLLTDSALRGSLREIVAGNAGVPLNALIGIAMKELRGKAEGSRIAAILKEMAH